MRFLIVLLAAFKCTGEARAEAFKSVHGLKDKPLVMIETESDSLEQHMDYVCREHERAKKERDNTRAQKLNEEPKDD